jgi:hypothetical protein
VLKNPEATKALEALAKERLARTERVHEAFGPAMV